MRILVFEYFCAGGGGERVEPAILAEARGILEAMVEDFAALRGVRVVTLRRETLPLRLPLPHEARVIVSGRGNDARPAGRGRSGRWTDARGGRDGTWSAVFRCALREVDAALIVAPEKDGILLRLTQEVERAGVPNLGSSSSAVRIASDKWLTYRALARAGLPQPRTLRIPPRAGDEGLRSALRRMGLPEPASRSGRPGCMAAPGSRGWILKPLDGYACQGVRALAEGRQSPARLRAALRGVRSHTRRTHVLLQEWIRGADASVSMIGDGRQAAPLSLNAQRLRQGEEFEYLGGEVPLAHPQARGALAIARRAAAAIPGLRGYFGIDMVLGDERAQVIEVNPRLTTSYLGLRRVAARNPAAWILDAAGGVLPGRPRLRGRVEFTISCPTSSAGTSAASI